MKPFEKCFVHAVHSDLARFCLYCFCMYNAACNIVGRANVPAFHVEIRFLLCVLFYNRIVNKMDNFWINIWSFKTKIFHSWNLKGNCVRNFILINKETTIDWIKIYKDNFGLKAAKMKIRDIPIPTLIERGEEW